MKKILTAMVLFVFVALPMSVMAMTSISDKDLSAVTGQSGVSIGADITMNVSMGGVAWGDTDGLATFSQAGHDTGSVGGGWVGIQNLAINNLRIHMRTDTGMIDTQVAYALGTEMGIFPAGGYPAFMVALTTGDVPAGAAALLSILATEQLMTIDIYTLGSDPSNGLGGKTYVRIGLPTFEITMGDLTLNTGLWTNTTANTPGTYQSLGQVYIGGLQLLIDKNNYVDISQNDTTSGVLIHVANATPGNPLMHVNFSAVSWGDLDGLNVGGTGSILGAGYVGIRGMSLALAVDMTMNINVGTTNGVGVQALLDSIAGLATPTDLANFKDGLLHLLQVNDPGTKDDVAYILHHMGTISATSVDIALAGTVNVSTMATQVVLADNAPLGGTYMGAFGSRAGILGNLYISGLQLQILGTAGSVPGMSAPQSWVSISAH